MPELTYVPRDELDAFWVACRRVDETRTTAKWLAAQNIDPQSVADGDLARAMPYGDGDANYELPKWAFYGNPTRGAKTWRELGYHLLVPQYNSRGEMCSVIARNVLSEVQRSDRFGHFGVGLPKTLPPRGHKRAGLAQLCPVALHLFRFGVMPAWREKNFPGAPIRFEVCEGDKKFLMRIIINDADEDAPFVIGVVSGSWTAELAARIPDGSELAIMTDQNDAGAQYATKIVRSLEARIVADMVRVALRPEFVLRRDQYSAPVVELRSVAA